MGTSWTYQSVGKTEETISDVSQQDVCIIEGYMLKIGTHDSATGEKARSWWMKLLTPFWKTQSKTIKEQYEAGCRMFDIRVKKVGREYYCAHGLFVTEKTAHEIFTELDNLGGCYVAVTWEGKMTTDEEKACFKSWYQRVRKKYKNTFWGPLATKYGKKGLKVSWINLYVGDKFEENVQGFYPLDGRNVWTYIFPVPYVINKIYKSPFKFNEDYFVLVDFL